MAKRKDIAAPRFETVEVPPEPLLPTFLSHRLRQSRHIFESVRIGDVDPAQETERNSIKAYSCLTEPGV